MSPSQAPTASQPDVIVIMGVAGCGKTVVGKLLAEQIGCEFFDADTHRVHYIRTPFQREPDFGVTSVNYHVKTLLMQSAEPS